uniref:F-box protein n=1 Tax=Globodera pallida TaxID=36090 RepID=A0A183BHW8_GLOPA
MILFLELLFSKNVGQRKGNICQKIWPLVNDNICGLGLFKSFLDYLRQFSPAILRNCPNLRLIDSFGVFPEFPAEDNAGASSDRALAKWLLNPRGDGLPKILQQLDEGAIDISTLYEDNRLLVHCPIVREEDKWAKWEKEAIELDWGRQWNCIEINFKDMDIGDGLDNAGASSRQAVAKWLLTPRGDGLPKILQWSLYSARLEGIKRSFVNASEPVNFIIRLLRSSSDGIEPQFELKNNLTEERLTLRRFNKDNWLLVRCPIMREEDKWTNWEEEAIGLQWCRQWNRIDINFKDRDIGDGMLDENAEGPSEPKKPKK